MANSTATNVRACIENARRTRIQGYRSASAYWLTLAKEWRTGTIR